MSLNLRSLILVCSSPHTADTPSTKLWFYASPDAAASIITDGYFNNARDQLSTNDVIIIHANVDGTAVLYVVTVTSVPDTGNITVDNTTLVNA